MSSGNKVYRFDIFNNQVVGVFKFDDGRWKNKTFDDDGNKTYTVDGGDVIRTEIKHFGVKITRYTDTDGDGLFNRVSEQWQAPSNNNDVYGGERKAYQFDIDSNNQVIRVLEFDDGRWKDKTFDRDGNKTYTVDGGDVIRTEIKHFGIEITRYADTDGDGLFNRVSEQWQASSNVPATGAIPAITDVIRYGFTDNDDAIAVRGGEDSHGGKGADKFIFREANHLRIGDFDSSEGDLLVFDTGFGLTSTEQLSNFITDTRYEGKDFVVNFGTDASITLVGIQPGQVDWDDVSVLS